MQSLLSKIILSVLSACLSLSGAYAAAPAAPATAPVWDEEVDFYDCPVCGEASEGPDLYGDADDFDLDLEPDCEFDPDCEETDEIEIDPVTEQDLQAIDRISFHLKNGEVIDFELPVHMMKELTI